MKSWIKAQKTEKIIVWHRFCKWIEKNVHLMLANDKSNADNRTRNLILGIAFDLIGMLSFSIPFLGEFSDVVWAPIAAIALSQMYKGTVGKIGGILEFVEEILPFSDFIPTFTLTWIYTYVINKQKDSTVVLLKKS